MAETIFAYDKYAKYSYKEVGTSLVNKSNECFCQKINSKFESYIKDIENMVTINQLIEILKKQIQYP